jgi:hypothetical protein
LPEASHRVEFAGEWVEMAEVMEMAEIAAELLTVAIEVVLTDLP